MRGTVNHRSRSPIAPAEAEAAAHHNYEKLHQYDSEIAPPPNGAEGMPEANGSQEGMHEANGAEDMPELVEH